MDEDEIVDRVELAMWNAIGEAFANSGVAARAAIAAYQSALAEAGFVVVPREPTEQMDSIGWTVLYNDGTPLLAETEHLVSWRCMMAVYLGEEWRPEMLVEQNPNWPQRTPKP